MDARSSAIPTPLTVPVQPAALIACGPYSATLPPSLVHPSSPARADDHGDRPGLAVQAEGADGEEVNPADSADATGRIEPRIACCPFALRSRTCGPGAGNAVEGGS